MYCLQAVIVTATALGGLIASAGSARVVPLFAAVGLGRHRDTADWLSA
ncbi:hypothetical protein [Amycolatopsis sp. lyj-84]